MNNVEELTVEETMDIVGGSWYGAGYVCGRLAHDAADAWDIYKHIRG